MTEPIPTSPTPTAVPWTPEMMSQTAPAPVVNSIPSAPSPVPVQSAVPVQHTPRPVAHPAHQPQMAPQQQMYQQAPAGQPMAQAMQPQQPVQSQQHAPQPYQHMQPQAQMAAQPAITPAMRQQQVLGQPVMGHTAHPAMAQQPMMHTAQMAAAPAAAVTESKSLTGSLFNKNFGLGAIAGLIIGAFLPVLIGMVTGGKSPAPVQAQALSPAQTQNIDPNSPALAIEDTSFLDSAIQSADNH